MGSGMTEPEFAFFDFGPLAVLSPRHGDERDLAEGYYLLERDERTAMRDALARHTEEVTFWYGLLSNHRRTLEGMSSPHPGDIAFVARRQILSLGLASSKAALDALLAGYYSVGYSSIRHMSECWFLSRYLECHPEMNAGLYARQPGSKNVKIPEAYELIKAVEKCNHPLAPTATARFMRKIWINMSKGAHVTGEGIVQTASNEDGVAHLGATYVPEMAVAGFAYGIQVGYYLVREALWRMRGESDEAAEVARDLRRALDSVITNMEKTYGKSDIDDSEQEEEN